MSVFSVTSECDWIKKNGEFAGKEAGVSLLQKCFFILMMKFA